MDYGGPYRELFMMINEELMSSSVPLFKHCPNYLNQQGENRDFFVPDPTRNSAIELEMYYFIGQILGMAHRSGLLLDISFSPLLWNTICQIEKTPQDLEMIDASSYLSLKSMEGFDEGVWEELEEEFRWTTKYSGSWGEERDLKKGGRWRRVKFGELGEFVEENLKFRILEAEKQEMEVMKGLGSLVPVHLLRLFTREEVRFFCFVFFPSKI